MNGGYLSTNEKCSGAESLSCGETTPVDWIGLGDWELMSEIAPSVGYPLPLSKRVSSGL